ncbi:hypothetical protein BN1723_009235 [Verticillium longisporum]|uniref:Uncharacterized protein n=1 Tax=Verticillium longisporum TaxID=100787 RepID=A0A0G4KMN2_VERLO|nr:hypothetical protein BN1723_009235 [Verticillium longisporum]
MATQDAPQQQAPMEASADEVISSQPTAEPQPDVELGLRGGEEAGCEICCGLCGCEESCC